MLVDGSNSFLLPFSLTSSETDVGGGSTAVDAGPRNVQLEFSRRPRRDYNYANALLRGRREQATDVWNGSSWKEHLQHGTIRAVPSVGDRI